MLEYLEGLSGIARKTTVDKAEKIMKDSDLSEKNSEEGQLILIVCLIWELLGVCFPLVRGGG